MSEFLRNLPDDNAIEILFADSPRDIEKLKIIAEELDNDTGRAIYQAIYLGTETSSAIADALHLTLQLVSYHIAKQVLAGLIKERVDSSWLSEKGKAVKHYVPAKMGIFIAPSSEALKKNPELERKSRAALYNLTKKIIPVLLIAILAFVALVSAVHGIDVFASSGIAPPALPSHQLVSTSPSSITSAVPTYPVVAETNPTVASTFTGYGNAGGASDTTVQSALGSEGNVAPSVLNSIAFAAQTFTAALRDKLAVAVGLIGSFLIAYVFERWRLGRGATD